MIRFLVMMPLFAAGAAAAAAIQPLATIETAVRDYVAAEVRDDADTEIRIGRLDPRLRLPLCDAPLATRFAQGWRRTGASSVEVRCEGSKPWSLYVGVTIDRYADIVVAARPLARGSVIGEADVTVARRRIAGARTDYLSDPADAIGQVAARPLRAEQIVGASVLKRRDLVKRGDAVVLASGGTAISVRMKGEALEDGAAGERIAVRNLSSERVVEGVVDAQGIVVVNAGSLL